MVAGQQAAVQVALLDMYGNTIDGSTLNRATPVVIQWNGLNLNATNNGLTFELIPGLNQTVATSGITINATYMGTQVATFSATCFPGLFVPSLPRCSSSRYMTAYKPVI